MERSGRKHPESRTTMALPFGRRMVRGILGQAQNDERRYTESHTTMALRFGRRMLRGILGQAQNDESVKDG